MDEDELNTLLFAATAHEVPTDKVNDALIRVLCSHLKLSQDYTDQRLSNQGYLFRLTKLVEKWNEAKRWDGEPDIVTRAYAQEIERVMSQRPIIRKGRHEGYAEVRLT